MPHYRVPRVKFTTALKPVRPAASADLELLRRSRAELERLHQAFDYHRGPDSDRLRMEIRIVEQKIADLRSRLKNLPDPTRPD